MSSPTEYLEQDSSSEEQSSVPSPLALLMKVAERTESHPILKNAYKIINHCFSNKPMDELDDLDIDTDALKILLETLEEQMGNHNPQTESKNITLLE